MMIKKSFLKMLLGFVLLLLAGWVLHRELGNLHYHDVLQAMSEVPGWRIGAAILLTCGSYLVLTCYDVLGLQYVRQPIPYRKAGLASFISFAFSNTIGLSLLTSGTIRYRMYSAWGLSIEQIGTLVLFGAATFWLGILTVGGAVFIADPQLSALLPAVFPLSPRYMGILLLLGVSGYLALVARGGMSLRLWKIDLPLPSLSLALKQVALGAVDWLLAGSVLVILLPQSPGLTFGQVLAAYLAAQVIALISHVPGGIGIFESLMILSLKGVPTQHLVGVLLVFRGIYYILPLVVAGGLAAVFELRERQLHLGGVVKQMERWSVVLLPHLFSLLVLVAGAVLLFSGATPAAAGRLHWLEDFLPLPVIESSHFLGSLVGACLLLLARGLQKRLDGAFFLSIGLLGLGIGFSLLKGGDYEEAILLGLMLLSLLPCRHFFNRRASLLNLTFSIGWISAIGTVVLTTIALSLFASKHVAYSSDLWWQFTLEADVPRSLRASVGATVLLLLFAFSRLLRSAPPVAGGVDSERLAAARKIIGSSSDTIGNLALLGDKQLLINSTGTAMIMYAVEGRSWVALGDPIGPEESHEELIWQFRDRCEQHNGWPIFYEVGTRRLHLYLDLGLSLVKLGEEARVLLPQFSLEGKKRSGLRYTHRRSEKDGYDFSIVPAESVPTIIDELKQVSDAWLGEKDTREKGFSLGFFSPDYLAANPVALVGKEGKIVAFANLWLSYDKEEVSIDLMRYHPEVSRGVMEYLFICLMLWGKDQGYRWFNLGMAPLSGLENRRGAPLWNRLGALLFRHGDNFYNFQGLREYKEKFDPVWEPRYLASPGGLALPLILTNIAALISGGVKGVFRK